MPEIQGTNSADLLNGTDQGDVIYGNHGNDTINGLDGDDVIYGGGNLQQLDTNGIVATNSTTAHVQLQSIAQGFHNGVGMYKVSADGTIHSVQILFAPDGGQGGGQGLEPNTSIDVELAAGEQLGFFVLGNGYGAGNVIGLLNDPNAQFEMRTDAGDAGLIVDTDLQLWHVDSVTGEATRLVNGNGHEIMHSIGTAENGFAPNTDGLAHAVAVVDSTTGTVTLGLEAQQNGGNLSFDDAIIIIEMGANNIEGLDDAIIPLTGTDNDIIDAGAGNDIVYGQTGNDRIDGGIGDDRLFGGKGNDSIFGGDGSDVILGNSGNDDLFGDDGDDDIKGGTDNDAVHGGEGDDNLSGGKDDDMLYGDGGNDTVFGDTGNDLVDGGEGDDLVMGGEGDDEVYGGPGNDTITGGKGNDLLDGGEGNDDVDADSGNDTIIASPGDDIYNGGSGIDLLDYSTAPSPVTVNLHDHTATSSLGTHTISSIENVTGSAFNDTLTGDKQDNVLTGGDGDDWLRGGKGNDTLAGGDGDDTYSWTRKDVTGETGIDNFIDMITGFDAGDVLDLSALTELAAGQTAGDVVQLSEAGGDTTVAALDAASGLWVDVAVLDDVIGLTVEALDAGGQLIV